MCHTALHISLPKLRINFRAHHLYNSDHYITSSLPFSSPTAAYHFNVVFYFPSARSPRYTTLIPPPSSSTITSSLFPHRLPSPLQLISLAYHALHTPFPKVNISLFLFTCTCPDCHLPIHIPHGLPPLLPTAVIIIIQLIPHSPRLTFHQPHYLVLS